MADKGGGGTRPAESASRMAQPIGLRRRREKSSRSFCFRIDIVHAFHWRAPGLMLRMPRRSAAGRRRHKRSPAPRSVDCSPPIGSWQHSPRQIAVVGAGLVRWSRICHRYSLNRLAPCVKGAIHDRARVVSNLAGNTGYLLFKLFLCASVCQRLCFLDSNNLQAQMIH
jgi:hypothetical protein